MRLVVLVAAILATAACSTSSPLTPSNGTWRFSGTVSGVVTGGRIGGPIAGARLTVVNGVNKDAQVTSDSDGRYAFTGMESGRFSVIIAAPGFVSVNPVVDLYRDLEVHFALKTQ